MIITFIPTSVLEDDDEDDELLLTMKICEDLQLAWIVAVSSYEITLLVRLQGSPKNQHYLPANMHTYVCV